MQYCMRCDTSRWVCETHNDRPFLGRFACDCGGAGAPCPVCNRTDQEDPTDLPAMPREKQPVAPIPSLYIALPFPGQTKRLPRELFWFGSGDGLEWPALRAL